jgi:hypothetical protein
MRCQFHLTVQILFEMFFILTHIQRDKYDLGSTKAEEK